MKKSLLKTLATISLSIIILTSSTTSASRADIIQWQSGNLQALQGWSYAGPLDTRTTIAFEYANTWTYGDLYMFVDTIHFQNDGSTYYGEFSPRFSLSKISGKNFSFGMVKDVLIATGFEKGEGTSLRRLIGGGVDLDIPGFSYFSVNLYHRNNPRLLGNTYQLTLAWLRPFKVGNLDFVFESFVDFAGSEGTTSSSIHTSPRLLLDISSAVGAKDGKLFLGTEVDIWHNQFGQEGVNESVAQLQLKLVF